MTNCCWLRRFGAKIAPLAALLMLLAASVATAQEVQNIAAIVNDKVISRYDLDQRIALTISLSGFPDTPQTRKQLAKPTLNRLIDDHLKEQEAKRLNISVSDEEVLRAMGQLEKNNGMPEGEILRQVEQHNIDQNTAFDQIRTNLLWNRLVQNRIMPRITISDEEVKAVQDRLEANRGKTEYLLSEIYLPADPGADEGQVRDAINNLVGQLRRGASFVRAAQQFSQGSSASTGGSIGWVLADEIQPEIAKALPFLADKEVSDPIRTTDGFYIVMIQKSRKVLENNPDDITLDMTQIIIPEGKDKDAAAQQNLADTVSRFVDSCETLPDLLKEFPGSGSSDIGKLRLGDLPDHIRTLVKDLKPNEVSKPYKDGNLYRIFVVCGRNDPQGHSDDPDEIRRDILIRRAENRARGYLQDLHNAATIEIR